MADYGKQNNGKTTGFKVVQNKALKQYGSEAAAQRVAGAVFQAVKKKKKP